MFRLACRLNAQFSTEIHLRNIRQQGIVNKNILFNPDVSELYEIAFLREAPSDPFTRDTLVSSSGALCAYSGLKTGREPHNSRLVKDVSTEQNVNWASKNNIPITSDSFRMVEQFAADYINHKKRCIVVDGYAGWDPKYRFKIRTFCTRSYHALFMRNMLIRPTEKELLEDFSQGADIHIFNGGEMHVSKNIPGFTDSTICALNLKDKKMVIMGTQFAGEMKKSIFKIMHYYFPQMGGLTLHASATVGKRGDHTIMCGLSATGKTAIALKDDRRILGDDEILWGPNGISAIEGGCYAKTINLDVKKEPAIYNAIKYGTIVENVGFYPGTRDINYSDSSITQNGRASFPLNFLPHSQIPAVGTHPENIIFLTCDTKGLLPPVSKLNPEQAAYQFLSGYTAKIGGTDLSSKSPESTFSACFGEIFLPLHPTVYAKMFYEKIKKHNVKVWLLNTGWTRGPYGVGRRIELEESEAMVDAIHSGALDNVETKLQPYFGFHVPAAVPGVHPDLMDPSLGWASKIEFNEALGSLAIEFIENYNRKFKGKMGQYSEAIQSAAPKI